MLASLRRLALARPAGARMMSGHSMEHAIAETSKWKKISYAFIPFCCVYSVAVYVMHGAHHHEHEEEAPKYPWMKKRDKMLPWTAAGGSACDLFDFDCSAKERAAKAALAE